MGWSTISVQQWCKWRTTAPTTSGLCPRFSFYTKPWFFEEEVAETWLSMQARNKMICWQESKMKTNVCEIEVHVRQEKFISTHQVPPRTTWRNTSCIVSLPSGTRSTTSAPVRAALTAATLRKTVGEREKIVSWWFGVFLKQERCRKDAGVNPFSSTRSSKMYRHTFQDLKCVTLTLPFPLPWNHCSYRPNNSQPMVNSCCLRPLLLAILASPRKEVRLEIWLYSLL